MKKVRVTGVQIPTPSMRFLNTFFSFSKLISSLKAQVCNILKNHIDIQILLLKGTVQRDGSGRLGSFDRTFLKESSRRGFSKIRPSPIE
jgi:hypothetical protein